MASSLSTVDLTWRDDRVLTAPRWTHQACGALRRPRIVVCNGEWYSSPSGVIDTLTQLSAAHRVGITVCPRRLCVCSTVYTDALIGRVQLDNSATDGVERCRGAHELLD